MQIGKRIVLVNPNLKKLACVLGIISGFMFWPSEAEYVRYDESKAQSPAPEIVKEETA